MFSKQALWEDLAPNPDLGCQGRDVKDVNQANMLQDKDILARFCEGVNRRNN